METRTVLFVDDDQETLNALKRTLRTEPYTSFFAKSGQEALDLLARERIHIVVTDLSMPEMGGLALLIQVEQKYPEIIRLVLSAHGDRDSILDAINKGSIYRYILKPWDNTELKLIVRKAIDVFNLQQQRRNLLKKLEEHNRLLEKRVEERTKQLLAVEREAEIGKYASQIVHNLNNPLQAIHGGLELADMIMSDENIDLKDLRECLHAVKSSAFDLKEIISGILIHARNKALHRSEQIDINEIIKRELDFFRLNPIYKYQIEKHVDLSDNLPCIVGNPIQIKQIIDNLVKNAIDAMEHSPEKRLTVETRLEDKAVVIRISDTGEGIAEEDLARIYSPDFTTKPIGKGTGLGLASVKTMVDAYSGDIQVESRKGEGTTFTVRIPIERPIGRT
ncbi:MAG: response regulator [Deltaproteobacteria bacterium]|nr:response regulator [Deltaproteobacteria bacterium]MBW2019332.1 response regulator [Deltaproteobacteria bacterium]MBW2074380.1 response regulator [Deltaproteobacteria bacterium]